MRYVIVDIDGTIARVGDRLSHLKEEPPNWDAFYERCGEDLPIPAIVQLVNKMGASFHHDVIFLTGRTESVRDKTEAWIAEYLDMHTYKLLMRPNGDHRHDTEVKPELLSRNQITIPEIAFILEDRNSMVEKWRELGATCLQVANGDF